VVCGEAYLISAFFYKVVGLDRVACGSV